MKLQGLHLSIIFEIEKILFVKPILRHEGSKEGKSFDYTWSILDLNVFKH